MVNAPAAIRRSRLSHRSRRARRARDARGQPQRAGRATASRAASSRGRALVAREAPAVTAGAGYNSGSGMSTRLGPPSRTSNRRSSARGFARSGWRDRAGSRSRPGTAPRTRARNTRTHDRDPRARDALRRSAAPARCRPSRRCRYSTTSRSSAAAGTRWAGSRHRPVPRTAANRRGACRRWRRTPSSPRRTRSRRPCARHWRDRAARPARADAGSDARRAPARRDRCRHREIEQRHAQQLVVKRRQAERAEQRVEREHAQAVHDAEDRAAQAACAAMSTDRSPADAGRETPPTGSPNRRNTARPSPRHRARSRANSVAAAAAVTGVIAKKYMTTRPMTNSTVYIRGPRLKVVAISCPQVSAVVSVASRTSENTASVNADGLKMCTRRPSRSQRTNALPRKPSAISTNCRANQSSLNQRNRFVLKTIGKGPKPRTYSSPRDHASSMSNA